MSTTVNTNRYTTIRLFYLTKFYDTVERGARRHWTDTQHGYYLYHFFIKVTKMRITIEMNSRRVSLLPSILLPSSMFVKNLVGHFWKNKHRVHGPYYLQNHIQLTASKWNCHKAWKALLAVYYEYMCTTNNLPCCDINNRLSIMKSSKIPILQLYVQSYSYKQCARQNGQISQRIIASHSQTLDPCLVDFINVSFQLTSAIFVAQKDPLH